MLDGLIIEKAPISAEADAGVVANGDAPIDSVTTAHRSS